MIIREADLMNINDLITKLVSYFATCTILYFLLPKLNLKSLEWISKTTKRRIITVIISIFLCGIIGGIIGDLNLKFVNIYALMPLAILIMVNYRISQLARLKI
jgi:hypothetical protein